ncbi:hypothetical protein MMC09_006844 [Bachmanniomyces sp. S44760]|nr:hypothetical protein [Bachmanniomyces sp. S44760]
MNSLPVLDLDQIYHGTNSSDNTDALASGYPIHGINSSSETPQSHTLEHNYPVFYNAPYLPEMNSVLQHHSTTSSMKLLAEDLDFESEDSAVGFSPGVSHSDDYISSDDLIEDKDDYEDDMDPIIFADADHNSLNSPPPASQGNPLVQDDQIHVIHDALEDMFTLEVQAHPSHLADPEDPNLFTTLLASTGGGFVQDALDDNISGFDLLDQEMNYEHNMDICSFLEEWRFRYEQRNLDFPRVGDQALSVREMPRPESIKIHDLKGDHYDYQGINWHEMGAVRKRARAVRNASYRPYTNILPQCDPTNTERKIAMSDARVLPTTDNHFRFVETRTRNKAHLSHFQLRNLVAAPSSNCVFYAARSKVMCVNVKLHSEDCVMNFISKPLSSSSSSDTPAPEKISTIAVGHSILLAGGFGGEYAMKSLQTADATPFISGTTSSQDNSIINHIHVISSRTSLSPTAILASNARFIHRLDCSTNTLLSPHKYDFPLNCTATSPDGRLRVLVGDDCTPLVVNAETGATITKLPRHADYGFACDWAADGIHLCTGNQDGVVQIFDARRFTSPIAMISTEIGGARSLHFSPPGSSGRRCLVVAEPADVISIVDGVTWQTRQRFDFFGEIGGTSLTDDGNTLFVSNLDRKFGGLMKFERCTGGMDMAEGSDWLDEGRLDADRRVISSRTKRKRFANADTIGDLLI